MAAVNRSNRNLWIIVALVLVAVAVLAWVLGSRGGLPGGDIADVSVEPAPATSFPGTQAR